LIGLLWIKPAKHRNLSSRQLDDGERQVHASWLDEHQKDQDRLQVIARSISLIPNKILEGASFFLLLSLCKLTTNCLFFVRYASTGPSHNLSFIAEMGFFVNELRFDIFFKLTFKIDCVQYYAAVTNNP
jgi:hypothetical protein